MDFIKTYSILFLGFAVLSTQANAADISIPIDNMEGYPSDIQLSFNNYKHDCLSVADKISKKHPVRVREGFIKKADVTGDGIDDYIVDESKLACAYGATAFGNRDFTYRVYQGLPNNQSSLIHEGTSALEGRPHYPRVVSNNQGYFDIQYVDRGVYCGQKGDFSFIQSKSCEITERWNDKSNSMDKISSKYEVFNFDDYDYTDYFNSFD